MEAIFDSVCPAEGSLSDMKVTGRARLGSRYYTVLAHEPGGKTDTFYFDAQTGTNRRRSEDPTKAGKW